MENINETFLDKLAQELFTVFGNDVAEKTIILPNKRAKVFLIEALKKYASRTLFAPSIISIEELVQDLSDIQSIDNIQLLFEFYKVYVDLTKSQNIQSFDQFANWGKILLQDFNEIDRYLLDTNHVFSYLKDIEVLKRWDLDASQTTEMINSNLDFWNKLPIYYNALYQHLLNKSIGYQGLVYREAVKNIESFSNKIKTNELIFAGFNALNHAEEIIFQELLKKGKAFVYWDIDEVFISDPYHDAGLFVRRFKRDWPVYKDHDFEWIINEFNTTKNIQIIGTPKTIGQAKIAGKIIEDISIKKQNLNKVAIILGDENLLIPTLYALPEAVPALNITMGYSNVNNPVQILIHKIFKLHSNALNRDALEYIFYYKDVLEVLTNPFVENILDTKHVVDSIKKNNITFISSVKLNDLFKNNDEFFLYLFGKWSDNIEDILDRFLSILTSIKLSLNNDKKDDLISKTFVLSIYKTFIQLKNYYKEYNLINSVSMLYSIYKQIIDLEDVSFEGEPLSGLQIMGVLESRVLDFEDVVVTSLNEGTFPAGKSSNSFIPNDIKKELGLPTFKEKDAIYSYHFYHILLRAKNIYLLYNSDPSEGLDKGEMSRFITQLEIDKQENHVITHSIYNAYLPEKAHLDIEINKSDLLLNRLKEIAQGKGFSPSSLGAYLRNPIDFYKKRVLGINDLEDVEENVAVNTLGTIIHGVLEDLYSPYLEKFLSEKDIEQMLILYPEIVLKRFKEEYKDGEINRGKNLIAFEVAKRNVYNFLKLELDSLKAGDAVKVLYLEHTLNVEINHPLLPYPVKIAGNVDRIEIRNNVYRIIDYKTGKVDSSQVKLTNWEHLIASDRKEKVIQLLCYALMFTNTNGFLPLEVGIISFKNLKSGFMPFGLKSNKDDFLITEDIIDNFKIEMVHLISKILDQNLSFKEIKK